MIASHLGGMSVESKAEAVTITVGMVTTDLWDGLASDCNGKISKSQSSSFKMSDQAQSENQFP